MRAAPARTDDLVSRVDRVPPRRAIVNQHRAVLVGSGEPPAVGAEGNAVDLSSTADAQHLLTGGGIPELDAAFRGRVVVAGRRDPSAVGTRHRVADSVAGRDADAALCHWIAANPARNGPPRRG